MQGGLSTSTMVKVEVEDINDNGEKILRKCIKTFLIFFSSAPVFFPREYNVTLQKSAGVGHQVVVVFINNIILIINNIILIITTIIIKSSPGGRCEG